MGELGGGDLEERLRDMRWICIIFLTVVLIGCSSQIQSKHTITFTLGGLYPVGVEWKELDNFVLSYPPDTCFEIDGPRSEEGFFDPVTASRVSRMRDYLNLLGRHVVVPKQPFWVYDEPASILIRTCERKAA